MDIDKLKETLAAATKGPWRVESETTLIWGNCNPDDQTNNGMGFPVAEARITPCGLWTKRPDSDEGEANSALIAMAPDLAAEVIRLTALVADLTAANAALMVRDAEAREVIHGAVDRGRGLNWVAARAWLGGK